MQVIVAFGAPQGNFLSGAERDSKIQLVDFNAAAGRGDEAVKLREEVLPLYRKVLGPDHAYTLDAIGILAISYWAIGRRDEALQLQEEALTLRPNDAMAHNEAAWLLATSPDKDGRYPHAKQAVEWARRANELTPNNGGLMNTLGVALYRFEQWKEAIDVLQKSIKLGNDMPHNWLFIAMAHWQLDQEDQAKQWYDKSLAWQSANASAVNGDAELQGFFAEAAKRMAPSNEGASGGKANTEAGSTKSKTGSPDSDNKDKSVANGNGD